MIVRRPRRGMGMDYYGLLAQANLQDCSPMDSACVSNNVAKQAAVEDLWSQYMSKPAGAPDTLKLTFTPQSQAEVTEFYNPQNLAFGGNVVDTSGIMTTNIPSPKPAPVVQRVPLPPVPARSGGAATLINSSGPLTAVKPVFNPSWTDTIVDLPGQAAAGSGSGSSGSTVAGIPWWVWAGGAAVAFFALRGGR